MRLRNGGFYAERVERAGKTGEEELKMRLAAAREKLAAQQLLIKEQKVPVLVLLEGWGTAGKGYCIGQIIENIDPRHFKVESMERKTEEEERKPFLYRHFTRIPEAGKFVFLDSGWMDEVAEERLHGELSEEEYAKRIESVRRFERQLTDNGYLVMKFFLPYLQEGADQTDGAACTDEKDTVWRVGKKDLWQNSHYEKCMDAFSSYLKSTNMPSAPWYIVDAKSKKWTELQVLETLTQGIDIALDNREYGGSASAECIPAERHAAAVVTIPLDKTIDEEDIQEGTERICRQRLGRAAQPPVP